MLSVVGHTRLGPRSPGELMAGRFPVSFRFTRQQSDKYLVICSLRVGFSSSFDAKR